jgi:cytoskeletal protein CcmA (bactofilin family)
VGELSFPGTVELPGYVRGRVEAAAIVIEASGDVEGDIHAPSITIRGRFSGEIHGGTVTLQSTAKVEGDIVYDSLSIESGAKLEGQCRPRAPVRGS